MHPGPRTQHHPRNCLHILLLCAGFITATAAVAADPAESRPRPGRPVVEIIEDEQMIILDESRRLREIRYPQEGDILPPFRVLLSRHRYWAQDGHLDVVVQLDPAAASARGVDLADTKLAGRLVSGDGMLLDRFEFDVPAAKFVFYPALPDGFLGAAELQVAWRHGRQALGAQRHLFRVETFEETAPRSGRIPISFPHVGNVRETLPATVGVPFPRGTLRDPAHLRLVTDDGREVPLQVMETARWSKFGSVRWVLCDFTARLDGAPRTYWLEYGPGVAAEPAEPIRIELRDEGFPLVEAGRLRADRGLWFDLNGDGEFVRMLDEHGLNGPFVEHEDGRRYLAPWRDQYAIEEVGPAKAVLLREGYYKEEDGDGQFCRYVIRYIFHRDSPIVRILHTWIFTGDGNRDRIRNMGWAFSLPPEFTRIGFLDSWGEAGRWLDADSLVHWDYEHVDLITDGTVETRAGMRAPGVAAAEGNGAALIFGARDFWQNYPSELEFRDGILWFHNWPRHNRPAGHTFEGELLTESGPPALASAARYAQVEPGRLTRSEWKLNAVQLRFAHEGEVLNFRLPDAFGRNPIQQSASRGRHQSINWVAGQVETANAQGVARTEEMWLILAPAGEQAAAAQVMEGLNEERLRAIVSPPWVAASGALHEMHHQDFDAYPEIERVFEQAALSFARIAERLGAYGMWVHGDIPAWNPRLTTMEPALYRAWRKRHHGWPFSWKLFARSGDPRLFRIAQAATRQMFDANWCHYVTAAVEDATGPDRLRRIGHWERGLLPWGQRNVSSTRSYEGSCDWMWHAWHLAGEYRARENALALAEQMKIEEPLFKRGPIQLEYTDGGARPHITLKKSWLDMYEATFDPWFLVAAQAVAEGHLRMYRQDNWHEQRGRAWETSDREWLRFTGCPEYTHYFPRFAHASTDFRNKGQAAAPPEFPSLAYGWKLTGDEMFLRRLVADIEYGMTIVQDRGEPDYFLGFPVTLGQATGYNIFASRYLRWFPTGLWALAQAERPPAPLYRAAFANVDRITIRKGENEDRAITLRASRNSINNPGDLAEYTLIGPDGQTILSGPWRMEERENFSIPAAAPAGDYQLRIDYLRIRRAGLDGVEIPVTDIDQPEVIRLKPEEPLFGMEPQSPLYFLVPEGVDRFSIVWPRRGDWPTVWDADGNRKWDFGDTPLDVDFPLRVEIEVPPGQAGRLWRIWQAPSGTRMDPRIPPIYAVDPLRWFMPGAAE